jgi:DNA replication protein DnaC
VKKRGEGIDFNLALEQIRKKAAMYQQSGKASSSGYKCEKCKDTETIHTMEWVTEEGYLNSKGDPMLFEKAVLKLCDCYYARMFDKYNASAGMKEDERGHTFKNATIDDHNRKFFEIAIDFVKNIEAHRQWGTWLYIFGDETRLKEKEQRAYGTGKTYLMQCIGNALTYRKIPALYIKEEKLFQDIKDTYNQDSDDTESEVLNRYYNVPILMIDDMFTASYKDWAEGKLFSILDNRLNNKKITIITSNYALDRISSRLPLNGGKIASRILGESQLLEMIGPDRRMARARENNDRRNGF